MLTPLTPPDEALSLVFPSKIRIHSPLQLNINTSCHPVKCFRLFGRDITGIKNSYLYKVPLTETESLDEKMRTNLTYVKPCIANKRFLSHIKNHDNHRKYDAVEENKESFVR